MTKKEKCIPWFVTQHVQANLFSKRLTKMKWLHESYFSEK
jgi:hypothetical protein